MLGVGLSPCRVAPTGSTRSTARPVGGHAGANYSDGVNDPTAAPAASTIAVGADHAGVHLKNELAQHLRDRGYEVLDLGTHDDSRVDYPDYGAAVGRAVTDGRAQLGVAVCGSGLGICMAANKIAGVRAATVHDATSARLTRAHNDANVICIGERLTGPEVAKDAVDAWLDAEFEGGRHAGRVEKLDALIIADLTEGA